MVHTRVSLHLLEETDDIDFEDGDNSDENEHNHHHHSNRVSVVGYAASTLIATIWTHKKPHMKRGCISPGTKGCRNENDNDDVGIVIGIGQKEYVLINVMDQRKYSASLDYKTIHDLSLSKLDVEDMTGWSPQLGVGKVERFTEALSMLQLVSKEEG